MSEYKDWNIKELTGYEPKTTFYMDFSIADAFGVQAVEDTYNRAFEEWKDNVVFVTELAMVLNWKMFEHYDKNPSLEKMYRKLWYTIDEWCVSNLKGDDLMYYYDTTD